MKEMILLGAGASVEAGVPDTYDMTKKIAELFHNSYHLKQNTRVLSFVIGGLLFQKGIGGSNPMVSGVNVEELFNAVQLLAERNELEAAPFIGSWHSMVQEFDKTTSSARVDQLYRTIYGDIIKELQGAFPYSPNTTDTENIDREVVKFVRESIEQAGRGNNISAHSIVGRRIGEYVSRTVRNWLEKLKKQSPSSSSNFGSEFRTAIEKLNKPGEGKIFQETAERMIRFLAEIVWIDFSQKVVYLNPLLSLLAKEGQLTIATLNYDNSIELLATENAVPYTTGIEDWSKEGFFRRPEHGLFLLKLHGSIDWALERTPYDDWDKMPHRVINQVSPEKVKNLDFMPAVIFGQGNKLTAEGPFLDLLRAFREELAGSNILTVVGYSFRDPHVNEYISQWLNRDVNNQLRIIDPSLRFQGKYDPDSYISQLRERCPKRINLIAKTASEGLVELFESKVYVGPNGSFDANGN